MNKRNGRLMAAVLLMGTAMGAMALEPGPDAIQIETQTVRFNDLDLGKPAGVAVLHWRLRVAASSVCFQGSGLRAVPRHRKCRDQAIARGLAGMPAAVHAYHAAWTADGAHWLAKPQARVRQHLASAR